MTDLDDPHVVLGVNPGATRAEIKSAYRQRALECHPDKRTACEQTDATKTFQRLSEAYTKLLQSAPDHPGDGPLGQQVPEPSMAEYGTLFSRDALHTFFLPRAFKSHRQSDAEGDAEADVLASVVAVSKSQAWPKRYHDMIAKLVEKPTRDFISQSLRSLVQGQAVAFWLRAQNAVLHIERLPCQKVMLRAWRTQLPSQDVMDPIPPCVSVPAAATCVAWDRVVCQAFCTVVADLAEEGALPHAASKVRQDPCLPVTILDYLLPVVCGESVDLKQSKYVWKKAACTQEERSPCDLVCFWLSGVCVT